MIEHKQHIKLKNLLTLLNTQIVAAIPYLMQHIQPYSDNSKWWDKVAILFEISNSIEQL